MSWDQITMVESVEQFLLRFLKIDINKLAQKAIDEVLEEKGLTYKKRHDRNNLIGDGMTFEKPTVIIKFSNGRVFRQKLAEVKCRDDEGIDFYEFREDGKVYEVKRIYYDE